MGFEHKEILKALFSLADAEYRDFQSTLVPNKSGVVGSLVPGDKGIIGVRMPKLRALAKEIAKSDYWEDFLESGGCGLYEEDMLRGLVIGLVKCSEQQRMEYVKGFVPTIDNWAVCDGFTGSLKSYKKQPELIEDYVNSCLLSDGEFTVRFAACMLMDYFINDKYIDSTLEKLSGITHSGYYAKMGAAWALAECFIKYRDKTLELFSRRSIDAWTQNKAIQKCRESYRVSLDDKELLLKYKLKP